ncbi:MULTISPECIES: hypothetical protein [Nostoc]|uniref:Uncharacterized protein n=1 Tax=Nostoc paludosum FACHB-159 TaxID=2692908 RepID=A0ABR8KA00_9NOSO|nr:MULTISPECIES: hypothetical protein [Nostoc]MBD2680053.1 hypothetical protein [Nostoc sp. FACHB-857]MBD2736309.1 hypothetical protein [Nostoc paludosum FACHB-159]
MLTTLPDTSANLAIALLIHYSFDLSGYTANELVERWQTQYPLNWLHLAVIEALYQGRYKAVSVQQILVFWQRREQATYHFNMEFERMVCSKFPQSLTSLAAPALPPAKKNPVFEKVTKPQLPPGKVSNGHQKSNTTTLQLNGHKQKSSLEQQEATEDKNGLKSTTASDLTSLARLGLPSAVSQRQTSSESASSVSHEPPKLLPPAAIRPPIGQFTPEKSDRSESFTSKLKAMSGEQGQ